MCIFYIPATSNLSRTKSEVRRNLFIDKRGGLEGGAVGEREGVWEKEGWWKRWRKDGEVRKSGREGERKMRRGKAQGTERKIHGKSKDGFYHPRTVFFHGFDPVTNRLLLFFREGVVCIFARQALIKLNLRVPCRWMHPK